MLENFDKILLALMIFFIMLGMGCTLRWSDFKIALQRPKGILVGLLCQFGLMPLIALGLAVAFEFDPLIALSLIIVGATPGGTT